jgi:hypothetical protein
MPRNCSGIWYQSFSASGNKQAPVLAAQKEQQAQPTHTPRSTDSKATAHHTGTCGELIQSHLVLAGTPTGKKGGRQANKGQRSEFLYSTQTADGR